MNEWPPLENWEMFIAKYSSLPLYIYMLKFIKPNGAKWLQNLQEPYFGDNPLEEKNLFATTIYSEINTLSLNM